MKCYNKCNRQEWLINSVWNIKQNKASVYRLIIVLCINLCRECVQLLGRNQLRGKYNLGGQLLLLSLSIGTSYSTKKGYINHWIVLESSVDSTW